MITKRIGMAALFWIVSANLQAQEPRARLAPPIPIDETIGSAVLQPYSSAPELHAPRRPIPETSLVFPINKQPHFYVARQADFQSVACQESRNHWWDNFAIAGGLDGAKEPLDLGINANFGMRFQAQWSFPIAEALGLGLQVGTAINHSSNAVRFLRGVDGTSEHTQYFTSIGAFQRSPFGINWGFVYDFRNDHYYANLFTTQMRAQVGVQVTPDDEFGVWGSWSDRNDSAVFAGRTLSIQSIAQTQVFWRHVWENNAMTRFWCGVGHEHGRFNILLPAEPTVQNAFAFGAEVNIPLSKYVSIYGEANFITPNDTGTVTAFLGLAFYPGGSAIDSTRNRFAPYLPVANHTNFPLDVR